MGYLVLSPSTCLQRQRAHSATTTTPGTSTPAGNVQYASARQTALVTTSSTLIIFALVLSTLLPSDLVLSIKMGLRVVPVYTLGRHLRAIPPTLFSCAPSPFTSRGHMRLSAAWFATATFVAIIWLYKGCTTLDWSKGTSVYIGLIVCALLEGGLVSIWGEGLFGNSLPVVQMRVQGAAVYAERKLEEGAAENQQGLAA